jgi:hypothetical protein
VPAKKPAEAKQAEAAAAHAEKAAEAAEEAAQRIEDAVPETDSKAKDLGAMAKVELKRAQQAYNEHVALLAESGNKPEGMADANYHLGKAHVLAILHGAGVEK